MDGQGELHLIGRRKSAAAVLTALSVFACFAGPAAAAPRATPSGQPVPRYIALKFDKVYARAGPGEDHRLLWVYRIKGLPVQVVAENSEWRRICDPEGGTAWVHKRLTTGEPMVLQRLAERLDLRKKPQPDAEVAAYLNPRALAALVRCDKGWCKVRIDGVSGWAPATAFWGTSDALQCRASAAR
jgi:SH3-like domain-containing protein